MQSLIATLTLMLATLASMPHASTTPSQATLAAHPSPIVATSTARMTVGTTTYTLPLIEDETLFQAMRTLASSTAFRFTAHEYPAMGSFIDSIDGKASSSGHYWILWHNGRKASVGASSLKLHAGDHVEWKYEKSY